MKNKSLYGALFCALLSLPNISAKTLAEHTKTPLIATYKQKTVFSTVAAFSKKYILKHPTKSILGVCMVGYAAVDFYNWQRGNDFLAVSAVIALRSTLKNSASWLTEKYHNITGVSILKTQYAELKKALEQDRKTHSEQIHTLTRKLECYAHCDIMLDCFKNLEIEINKKLAVLRENAEKDHDALENTTNKLNRLAQELRNQFGTTI